MNRTLLDDAISSVKSGTERVFSMYDDHVRGKAIKEVNEKIKEKGIDLEQIATDDYEAMISDLSKDIKEEYAKKTAQGLFAFVGLDLLFGW